MEKTYIIGVGMSQFGRFPDRSVADLAGDAQGQIGHIDARNHAHLLLQQTELLGLCPTGEGAGVALPGNGGIFNGYEEAAAVIKLLQL